MKWDLNAGGKRERDKKDERKKDSMNEIGKG
jgi:hypothetical protein